MRAILLYGLVSHKAKLLKYPQVTHRLADYPLLEAQYNEPLRRYYLITHTYTM